jgi:hypothetical protein
MPSTRALANAQRLARYLALALLTLTLVPSFAAADAPGAVALPGTPDVPPLPTPTVTARGLANRWMTFRSAEPGSAEERAAFEAVRLGALELGVANLADHARTLLLDASEAPAPRAAQLTEWAALLAPDSAEVASAQLDAQWSQAPWSVLALARRALDARAAALDTPEARLRMEADRWRLLLWLAVALALCFSAAQVVRYFGLAAYDIASRLGHVVGLGWARALLLLAVALPAALVGSPLVALLVVLVLLWPYQRRAERVLTGAALLCMAAVPLLVGQLAATQAASPAQASFYHRAQSDLCDQPCAARLQEVSEAETDNPLGRFTAALLASRRGTTAELTHAWNLLRDPFDPPLEDAAQLLRGNVLAASGRAHQALGHYRPLTEAEGVHPAIRIAATFNAYRSLQDQGADSTAATFLEAAQGLDREGVIAFIEGAQRQANRWYMNPALPADLIVEAAGQLGAHPTAAGVRELSRPLLGSLSRAAFLAVLAAGIALIALLTLWQRRLEPSRSCPQCGMVMSPREAPVQAAAGYCPDCYTLYMEGAALDLETRRALEARVTRHDHTRRSTTIVANILGAGLGFVIRGSVAVGAPFLVLAVVGVVALVAPADAVRSFALSAPSFDAARALAVAALVLAFIGSWATTWARRGSL